MNDIKQTFTHIYSNKVWGKGESENPYFSGGGSHDDAIIIPYIEKVCDLLKDKNISTICDIGCGDFNIMQSVLQQSLYKKYYGIDVVEGLIDYNNRIFGNDKTVFLCVDATDISQELPKTELLIIRQVLQHLDNEHIKMILDRAKSYRYVLVTEHLPLIPWRGVNRDKPINNEIRLKQGSGVYIECKPFGYHCEHILSVRAGRLSVIRTSLIQNINGINC